MAEGTLVRPAYVDRLARALEQQFSGAEVRYEPIRRDRYRFFMIWRGFEGMGHPERQSAVWEVAAAALESADLIKVGMIITMAPTEFDDETPEQTE